MLMMRWGWRRSAVAVEETLFERVVATWIPMGLWRRILMVEQSALLQAVMLVIRMNEVGEWKMWVVLRLALCRLLRVLGCS